MPVNQHRNDTVMNRPTFTRVTGTPTARALAALPPTAKIQLPIFVRCRIQADGNAGLAFLGPAPAWPGFRTLRVVAKRTETAAVLSCPPLGTRQGSLIERY